MDSPGNDLESVAGQVASGANLILFTTGNGSITNFPFVPTIKIITTTDREKLMPTEMDVNAGRYQDVMPMEQLATETERGARMTRRQRKNGVPVAGTRIVRDWHGKRHEVTVTEGGFEYEGRRYRSLSAIARAITGTRWNGPAFFGLRKPERQKEARG